MQAEPLYRPTPGIHMIGHGVKEDSIHIKKNGLEAIHLRTVLTVIFPIQDYKSFFSS